MSLRILIVEDEPVIAEDLAITLEKAGYVITGKAMTPSQALDMFVTRQPDLVFLDISLKGDMDGIDLAGILNEKYGIPFVFLTSFSDKITLERAKLVMPYAYIVKPFRDRDLISALEIAWHRFQQQSQHKELSDEHINSNLEEGLSRMEIRVLRLICKGKSNGEIADELFVSVNTVKTHLKNIYRKYGVGSRSKLIVKVNQ